MKKRRAPWWAEPAATVVALTAFGLYSLWEVFFHSTGTYQNYVSPFFSPNVAAWGVHFVPALWVIWAPLLFRASCYYYRKEYYRGFFGDPSACARPERPGRTYTGETRLPLALNNLHRFFFYIAVIVVLFLWKDAIEAFFFPTGFGIGLGSLIMLGNVILLSFYTFSCHAFRHLIGGNLDCFTCNLRPRTRYGLWRAVTDWNMRHGQWAWISMFTVWGTDLYIRLLISGVLHDPRIIF